MGFSPRVSISPKRMMIQVNARHAWAEAHATNPMHPSESREGALRRQSLQVKGCIQGVHRRLLAVANGDGNTTIVKRDQAGLIGA